MSPTWIDVFTAVRATLIADGTLTGVVPAADIYRAGDKAFTVPAIEMTLVSDSKRETTSPVLIQFDLWAKTEAQLSTMEDRVLALVTDSVPMTLNGTVMWALYQTGRVLPGPDDGVLSRSFDVEYQPIREPADR